MNNTNGDIKNTKSPSSSYPASPKPGLLPMLRQPNSRTRWSLVFIVVVLYSIVSVLRYHVNFYASYSMICTDDTLCSMDQPTIQKSRSVSTTTTKATIASSTVPSTPPDLGDTKFLRNSTTNDDSGDSSKERPMTHTVPTKPAALEGTKELRDSASNDHDSEEDDSSSKERTASRNATSERSTSIEKQDSATINKSDNSSKEKSASNDVPNKHMEPAGLPDSATVESGSASVEADSATVEPSEKLSKDSSAKEGDESNDSKRSHERGLNEEKLAALVASKCICREGTILCSKSYALEHCKCEESGNIRCDVTKKDNNLLKYLRKKKREKKEREAAKLSREEQEREKEAKKKLDELIRRKEERDRRETEERERIKNEKPPNDMTIVILSMDRFQSLRRLLKSLLAAEYPTKLSETNSSSLENRQHKIDLVIRFDRPSKFVANNIVTLNNHTSSHSEEKNWRNEISSIAEWMEKEWHHGTTSVIVSDENMGLAQAWLRAWEPKTKFDRALILEDDLEVSPVYYKWLTAAHDNYGYGYHDSDQHGEPDAKKPIDDSQGFFQNPGPKIPDLASFGLSRQTMVVSSKDFKKSKRNAAMFPSDEPFLYALLGSHGFSPLAHVWMEFLDFAKCSNNLNTFFGKCYTPGSDKSFRKKEIEAAKSNKTVEIDIHIPGFVTSQWYKKNKGQMWTHHFVYFCRENQLYNLYRHTPPAPRNNKGVKMNALANKAFVAHWKEKGAHFDGNYSNARDFPLLQLGDIEKSTSGGSSIMDFPPPSTLKRFDFGANRVTMLNHIEYGTLGNQTSSTSDTSSQILPPVIMSAATGYSLEHFEIFVGSLRKYYFGDVWLLITKATKTKKLGNGTYVELLAREEASESTLIRRYLKMHNVRYIEVGAGKSGDVTGGAYWEKLNRARFEFFDAVCDPSTYSLCLTTDFRDSIFQSNPFANMDRLLLPPKASANSSSPTPLGILHVFEHNLDMTKWHYEKMKQPECNLYEAYGRVLDGTKIINGGSIIGSPWAFKRIGEFMADIWNGCNDQVILNVLVRADILTLNSTIETTNSTSEVTTYHNGTENSTSFLRRFKTKNPPIVVKVHQQGYGPLNVLGHGGMVLKNNGGKFMNRNCIVTPAVHQYDRVLCPQ